MVDEVEIKITADASEAQKALRNTDFYIKALQEDTELLKDLQLEYKEALAETGGKLTGKALKLHQQILDVKSSIAKSERAIEKSGKGQFKAFKGISKLFGGKLGAIGTMGSVAGGVYLTKMLMGWAGDIAQSARSEYLSSMSTGLSPTQYSGFRSGAGLAGVEEQNINRVLSNLNEGVLSLEKGYGDFSKVVNLANRTGISLTDEKGRYKTADRLLKDIQEWVKTQRPDEALHALRDVGFTPDIIDAMKKGNLIENKTYAITDEERKRLDVVAKEMNRSNQAWSKLKTQLAGSLPAEGFYMLMADAAELFISKEEKPDTRTEEEKEQDKRRKWAVERIVQFKKYATNERKFAEDAWFDWSKNRHLRNAEAYEEEIKNLEDALRQKDYEAIKTGNYKKSKSQVVKIKEPSKKENRVEKRIKKYQEEGFEVLNLSTIPEKASTTIEGGTTIVINQENNNVVNAETPATADEIAGTIVEQSRTAAHNALNSSVRGF